MDQNPYQPPQINTYQPGEKFTYDPRRFFAFHSSPLLMPTLLVLLGLHVVPNVLTVVLEVYNLAFYGGDGLDMIDDSGSNSLLFLALAYMAVGLGQVLLLIATAVAWGIWSYRANANLRSLGVAGLESTPGWTVGWFYIPIANLFKPYQAFSEIDRASSPDADLMHWKSRSTSGLIGVWWGLWIVNNIIGQISMRTSMAESSDIRQVSSYFGLAGGIVGVILCVAAIMVVRHIHAQQMAKYEKLSSNPPSNPPTQQPLFPSSNASTPVATA